MSLWWCILLVPSLLVLLAALIRDIARQADKQDS